MNLSVKDGSFYYKPNDIIFENISFSVNSGEILAILGPNGAGKTTLLKCITGMLRWRDGVSLIDNKDIRKIKSRDFWNRVSYVPQSRTVSSSFTALETVLIGLSGKIGVFSSPDKDDILKAEKALEELGISKLRDKCCNEMSGGELQMVLIAKAIVSEPELLILDEPESNLDFKNQLIVLNTISKLAQDGIACIFNTHYPEHALQRSDKALILSQKKSVFGYTTAVVTEENIEKAFGVRAVIGEIETDESIMKNVIPLKISDSGNSCSVNEDTDCLASVSIIIKDFKFSESVNKILHEYNEIIIGRMGMPYKKKNVFIINVSFDSKKRRIEEVSHRLSLLCGVSVKTTYSK